MSWPEWDGRTAERPLTVDSISPTAPSSWPATSRGTSSAPSSARSRLRGGSVHPFLNAVTDVLVVGRARGEPERTPSGPASRSGGARSTADRWGHLEFVTEEELRGALEDGREARARR